MPFSSLLSTLPRPRGKCTENAPLGTTGWFQCGGTADVMFKPADSDDLVDFLEQIPADIPIHTFGVLSNTIVRDGGLRGITLRLGREFTALRKIDTTTLHVGAALLDSHLARFAAEQGLSGFEFLGGIPGTIGGALRMNAGAIGAAAQNGGGDIYGQTSMRDILITATAIDRYGTRHTVTADDLHMTYRHTNAPDDWIFTDCTLRGIPDDPAIIADRMTTLKERREAAQPVREKTGGSTFANPSPNELVAVGLPTTTRCWELIDQAGGRGLTIGGAKMSDKHCNFMINTGSASAYDLEKLGETIKAKVYATSGIELKWEIRRVGDFILGQEINVGKNSGLF